jgi:hypothetical protein
MLFAVKVGAVALPLLSLVTVTTFGVGDPPVNVPLAPLEGAVKVTNTPLMPKPDSDTLTSKSVGNAVSTVVLCGVPAVAVTV